MSEEFDRYNTKKEKKDKDKKKRRKEKKDRKIVDEIAVDPNLSDIQRVMKRNRELMAENELLKKRLSELLN